MSLSISAFEILPVSCAENLGSWSSTMRVSGHEPVAAIPHLRSKKIKVTANTRHSPWVTPKLTALSMKRWVFRVHLLREEKLAAVLVGLAIASVGVTDVALAGLPIPVPGPIAGAGLPAVAVAGGALWLFRKLRSPRQ